jgi:hypothetical protein
VGGVVRPLLSIGFGLVCCLVGLGFMVMPAAGVLAVGSDCYHVEADGSVRGPSGFHAVVPGGQVFGLVVGLPIFLIGFTGIIGGVRHIVLGRRTTPAAALKVEAP